MTRYKKSRTKIRDSYEAFKIRAWETVLLLSAIGVIAAYIKDLFL